MKQSSLSVLGFSFLAAGAAGFGANDIVAAENPPKETSDNNATKLRSITYNVFNGCIGYKGINGKQLPPGEDSDLVKTARDMGQIPRRIMLELALYQPNIINFPESPKENVVKEMAEMLDLNYAFFAGAKNGQGNYPGSVFSTYEIVSSETRPFVNKKENNPERLFTRHWGKAKLQLPNGKILTIHSAHLWPFKKSESDTQIRLDEIKELTASIKYDLENGSDSVLLQGDLNQIPDTPEYRILRAAGLIDAFVAKGNGTGYTINSILPTRRIDYIFAIGDISNRIKNCTPLFQGNFRMNMDDPKAFALSDHIPVLADFEL